jgi:hypothetical protein
MKCEICGKQYIALGVHIRHKHGVDPDDYRDTYGLMRTAPLVDKDLSDQIRASAKRRLQDDEYKAEVQNRCRKNAEANKGKPGPRMSQAAKAKLAKRNSENNEKYIREKSSLVANVLMEKKTMRDVRLALGVGPNAAQKMASIENVGWTKDLAKMERKRRALAAMRKKTLQLVEKTTPYLYTTKSVPEMCSLAGISTKTYRKWLKAGLMQRHPLSKATKNMIK